MRDALRAEGRGAAPDREVQTILHIACNAAHAGDTHVKHVLILLKEAWRALPEARTRTHADGHAQLAHVLTLCSEEY